MIKRIVLVCLLFTALTVKGTLKLNTGNAMDNPSIALIGAKSI